MKMPMCCFYMGEIGEKGLEERTFFEKVKNSTTPNIAFVE